MTTGKTVPELTSETPPIVGTDEVVVYRAPGPLKRTTAAEMQTFMDAQLRSDLATTSGAGLIGTTRSGTAQASFDLLGTPPAVLSEKFYLTNELTAAEITDIATQAGLIDVSAKLNALIATANGREVYLPQGGRVRCDSTISLVTSSSSAFVPGLKLFGTGWDSTMLDSRVANGPAIKVDTTTGFKFQRGIILDGMQITAQYGTGATCDGIELRRAYDFYTGDVYFNDLRRGIYNKVIINDQDSSNNFTISAKTRFNNCRKWAFDHEPIAGQNDTSLLIWEAFIQGCGTKEWYDITAASLGATTTLTIPGHTFSAGERVIILGITGGPTALNETDVLLTGVTSTTVTFATNSTSFGAWTAGGIVMRAEPTSGAIKWKGQLGQFRGGAITETQNVGVLIPYGGGAVSYKTDLDNFAIENVVGVSIIVNGCDGLAIRNGDLRANQNAVGVNYGHILLNATQGSIKGVQIDRPTLIHFGGTTAFLDGAITAGTPNFVSASSTFVAGDVGKIIFIDGAGVAGATLKTTISAFVSATAVTLAANASTTVTGADGSYGISQGMVPYHRGITAIPGAGGPVDITVDGPIKKEYDTDVATTYSTAVATRKVFGDGIYGTSGLNLTELGQALFEPASVDRQVFTSANPSFTPDIRVADHGQIVLGSGASGTLTLNNFVTGLLPGSAQAGLEYKVLIANNSGGTISLAYGMGTVGAPTTIANGAQAIGSWIYDATLGWFQSSPWTVNATVSVTPSSFASQTANTFLAAPNGSAGVPTFRTMAVADLPSLLAVPGAQITGSVGIPVSGSGLEISGGASGVIVAGTRTASVLSYNTLALDGSTVSLRPSGTSALNVNAGVITAVGASFDEAVETTYTAAATTNIANAASNSCLINGTTTITALGTTTSGVIRRVRFSGILTLTHNATSLILPTGANITTAAGDTAEFMSLGSGNWVCTRYNRASGAALSSSGGTPIETQTFAASGTWTKPAGSPTRVEVYVFGAGGGGGGGGKAASGTAVSGGGGGGGGAVAFANFAASDLGATEAVTVGAGGTGGPGSTVNNTAATQGTGGGASDFGTKVYAYGGGGAGGGDDAVNAGGGGGGTIYGAGGNASTTGGAAGAGAGAGAGSTNVGGTSGTVYGGGGSGNPSTGAGGDYGGYGGAFGASGGGGGGGVSTTPTASIGYGGRPGPGTNGNVTTANAAATGAAGTTHALATTTQLRAGGGGGGGGASTTTNGGNGGVGQAPGGGGGGGGASISNNGGAGGNGGSGRVVVITYY